MFDFCLITPIYHGVDGVTCFCVEKAHQAGLNFMWYPGSMGKGDALIARSRSVACTAFLEYGQSDYMIFLDSDILFEPEHLKKLNMHQKHGYDLIGGVYPVRSGTQISSYWWEGKAPTGAPGVYPVQFLATGFMGISKRLLQKIVDDLKLPLLHGKTPNFRSYPFFEDHSGKIDHPDESGSTHIWISEDWDFCEKARKVGVEPYIDTTILLGHQGDQILTIDRIGEHKEEEAKLKEEKKEREEHPEDWVGKSIGETNA